MVTTNVAVYGTYFIIKFKKKKYSDNGNVTISPAFLM